MRAVVLALLALPGLARADVVTTVGISLDGRATGPTFAKTADSPVESILGGGRLTMSFESAPLAVPPVGSYVRDTRLVPELLAGFLADDTHAEGYVGAGARLELRIASMKHERLWRGGFYFAGRGVLVGGHQDGAIARVTTRLPIRRASSTRSSRCTSAARCRRNSRRRTRSVRP